MRNIFNSQKTFNIRNISGLTMVELMVAVVVLALLFLPVYGFLTGAVKRTDSLYAESVAFTRARCIMDFLHKQLPFQAVRQGNPAEVGFLADPRNLTPAEITAYNTLITTTFSQILGNDSADEAPILAEGVYTCPKGFMFQTRVSVTEQTDGDSGDEQLFLLPIQKSASSVGRPATKEIMPRNYEGSYAVIKKIIVQVRWSEQKNKHPKDNSRSKSIFLVAYKSNLGA